MDDTIELSDSSVGKTIVLDSTNEDESKKNDTIELDSTNDGIDENGTENEHFITATSNITANNTNFESPTITSTPNIPPRQSTSMFEEVEDEFAHDDSFGEEVTRTTIAKESTLEESNKTPVETHRQISSE